MAGQIELAAALGVLVLPLISSKSRLHTFAVSQLSELELHDAHLAGAALMCCCCCWIGPSTRLAS